MRKWLKKRIQTRRRKNNKIKSEFEDVLVSVFLSSLSLSSFEEILSLFLDIPPDDHRFVKK